MLRPPDLARQSVAVTLTLVMVASTLLGANILCIGAEGHVSIESSFRDCCEGDRTSCSPAASDATSPSAFLAVLAVIAPEPLGTGCIDFTLRSVVLPARPDSSGTQLSPPVVAALQFATARAGVAGDAAACHPSALHGLRRPVALTRLQGVLLRC